MPCPVCNLRKAKRACPAIGKSICAVCCGTKRLVEINCPADCGYLASSRAHPPAIVQRQQEMDRAMVLPLLQGLSERQARVFLMLAATTARHQGEMLQKLVDEDIAHAAGALAATLETAGRGIVYEHQPASLPAARLMAELKTLVDEMSKSAGSALDRDAALALRRIEHGSKMMVTIRPNANEFQQLLGRVLAPAAASAGQQEAPVPAPSLIVP
ncbi:MAG TPA: hypothetical protein VJM31_19430 [Vicinamibacterales bacterium]|nr:hypothetical protein [Vicinamibacterales bacterium]